LGRPIFCHGVGRFGLLLTASLPPGFASNPHLF
jgi:hypothetical protein